MTSNRWQWTAAIVPSILGDVFRETAWRVIAEPESDFTVGGVVNRLVKLSDASLFILATPTLVVATSATQAARDTIIASIQSRPIFYPYTPQTVEYGAYPVISDGVTASVSVKLNGVELSFDDPRRFVLTPVFPKFTASSIVNKVADSLGLTDWILLLDQHTGLVIASPGVSPPFITAALSTVGVDALAAFNTIPSPKSL